MIEAERNRRQAAWESLLAQGGPNGVPAGMLRQLGIYGGAQGIWVDLEHTRGLAGNDYGVTVGLLHTGERYADDFEEDGVTYHYPDTQRPASRDRSEIEATKNALSAALPVFVITTNQQDTTLRDVHLGWVTGWNDDEQTVRVQFTREPPAQVLTQPQAEAPLDLEGGGERGRAETYTRPGQQRFSFQVFQRYGECCAVCDIDEPSLLDAAHIKSVREHGPDDPRNGLVLCVLHHRALDAGLFGINPDTLQIQYKPGYDAARLHLTRDDLSHLPNVPHRDALAWLWDRTEAARA